MGTVSFELYKVLRPWLVHEIELQFQTTSNYQAAVAFSPSQAGGDGAFHVVSVSFADASADNTSQDFADAMQGGGSRI
jgi:hypothetical protein